MSTVPFRDAGHDADGSQAMRCLHCEAPVELHQPDTELPNRLLATCGACKAWYVLADASASLLAAPEADRLRRRRRSPRPPVVA